MVQEFIAAIPTFPLSIAVGIITLYQHTLSPDHGPLRHLWKHGYCRHSPTCSDYAKQVLRERGLVIGSLLATKRILPCNPFTKPSDEKFQLLAEKTLSSHS